MLLLKVLSKYTILPRPKPLISPILTTYVVKFD